MREEEMLFSHDGTMPQTWEREKYFNWPDTVWKVIILRLSTFHRALEQYTNQSSIHRRPRKKASRSFLRSEKTNYLSNNINVSRRVCVLFFRSPTPRHKLGVVLLVLFACAIGFMHLKFPLVILFSFLSSFHHDESNGNSPSFFKAFETRRDKFGSDES